MADNKKENIQVAIKEIQSNHSEETLLNVDPSIITDGSLLNLYKSTLYINGELVEPTLLRVLIMHLERAKSETEFEDKLYNSIKWLEGQSQEDGIRRIWQDPKKLYQRGRMLYDLKIKNNNMLPQKEILKFLLYALGAFDQNNKTLDYLVYTLNQNVEEELKTILQEKHSLIMTTETKVIHLTSLNSGKATLKTLVKADISSPLNNDEKAEYESEIVTCITEEGIKITEAKFAVDGQLVQLNLFEKIKSYLEEICKKIWGAVTFSSLNKQEINRSETNKDFKNKQDVSKSSKIRGI